MEERSAVDIHGWKINYPFISLSCGNFWRLAVNFFKFSFIRVYPPRCAPPSVVKDFAFLCACVVNAMVNAVVNAL